MVNEGGYVVCCCPNLRRDWTVPEEVGYVNEGVGAPGAIGAIHGYHCHWASKGERVVCYLPNWSTMIYTQLSTTLLPSYPEGLKLVLT